MARIDYATLRFRSLDDIPADLMAWGPYVDRSLHGYDRMASGPFGSRLYVSTETGAALVQLPGTFCESAKSALWALLYAADSCSRIDLCEDLALGSFVPALMERARAGAVVGCKVWKCIESTTGQTVYLGSRQSSIMVRGYDQRGVDRLEVECKEDAAENVWKYLTHGGHCAAALRGLLDRFKAVEVGGVNRSRAAVCAFWRDLLGAIGDRVATIARSKPFKSLERSREWLMRSVAPLLSTMFDYEGPSLLVDILNSRRRDLLPGLWACEARLAVT